LKLCHTLGLSQTTGAGLVEAEKVRQYRDTRGISLPLMKKLLDLPGTADVKGLRDTFLLRLAFENGLRRMEISALDVSDLQLRERRLQIRGKGRGTQKEFVDVSPRLIAAARAYLKASGHRSGPLFRNVSPNTAGRGAEGRLTPDGVYYVVSYYGRQLGLTLSPHRLRHTAITQAAKEVNGDLMALLEFSRHKDIKTAQIYVDNVQAAQRKITNKLSRKV
ncbi:MAG: tyrosine-type recombinase/integrase, partial [Armatimonadota bacterium]